MASVLEVWIVSLLAIITALAVKQRPERRNWKLNNRSTRSRITHQISRDKIIKTGTDKKCELCKKIYETVEYIISACPITPKEQYIKR